MKMLHLVFTNCTISFYCFNNRMVNLCIRFCTISSGTDSMSSGRVSIFYFQILQNRNFRFFSVNTEKKTKKSLSSSISITTNFTFLVLLFWTFLVRFSGPPTPSCQKEQENHKIRPEMSRIVTRKVKETQKIAFQSPFLKMRP